MNAPIDFTLALDGTIQQITKTLDATGLVNFYADDDVQIQLSNASGGTCFLKYSTTAPATLDKTTAGADLIAGQGDNVPFSERMKLRGRQINLRFLWAKGQAGDYLHVWRSSPVLPA